MKPNRRDKYVKARFSEDEFRALDTNAKAVKMTRSAYLRHATIDVLPEQAIAFFQQAEALKQIRIELLKQGTNLNQIARSYNTYGTERAMEFFEDVLSRLLVASNMLYERIDQVLDQLYRDQEGGE